MPEMNIKVGWQVRFSKTVGETDIYLFAGITGDFSGNHVNEEFMKKSAFGGRIAHGVLIVGYMSTASTMMINRCLAEDSDTTPVSLGYDHVRFVAPVHIGDTVTVTYQVTKIDAATLRTYADISATNQRGEVVAVAKHILKWVPNPVAASANPGA
jgi:3-hydroxybutyryl-CoA dehydratase